MNYKNPIIFSDYSDPDVIEFDNQFIMTASSFNYIPALPILVSKDLIHFELVNYAIKENLGYSKFDKPCYSQGVWAPAIRKHSNQYYIFYGMPDEGIFEVHTTNPLSTWSKPNLVKEGKGLIDPCPFWDGEKAYVIHAYAKSRIGFKSKLGIFEIDKKTNKSIGEDTLLYDGLDTNPTIEGPKVYKRNNYYYIFAPAGGVATGWQTVLRSKNLFGPFEEKIVLSQQDTNINGPHQGAMVKDKFNKYWFIHFQDKGLYGRIIHLQPLKWEDDWPIIAKNGKPVLEYQSPYPESSPQTKLDTSDLFNKDKLSLFWQWSANFRKEFCSFSKSGIILHSIFEQNGNLEIRKYPNILSQKIIYKSFKVSVDCHFENLCENEEAGLAFIDRTNISIAIRKEKNSFNIYLKNEERSMLLEKIDTELSPIKLILTLKENDKNITCGYKKLNERSKYKTTTIIKDIVSWVGMKIGLYSISKEQKDKYGEAKFSNFLVMEQ